MLLAYQSIQRRRHRVGRSARRIGRGDAEQFEAAHRPQPLGQLAIIEPAAVPFVARCRSMALRMIAKVISISTSGELELEVRRHERAEADAHRDTAEHEVEDVAAAIGLGEVRREPIGPAIGLLEQVDRRGDLVRVGAACTVAFPFVADLSASQCLALTSLLPNRLTPATASISGYSMRARIRRSRSFMNPLRKPCSCASGGGSISPLEQSVNVRTVERAFDRRRR